MTHATLLRLALALPLSSAVVAGGLPVRAQADADGAAEAGDPEADDDDAPDMTGLSVAGRAGYGLAFGADEPDPVGAMVDARLDVVLPGNVPLMLGGSLDATIGNRLRQPGFPNQGAHTMHALVNVGYQLTFGKIALRPGMGFGVELLGQRYAGAFHYNVGFAMAVDLRAMLFVSRRVAIDVSGRFGFGFHGEEADAVSSFVGLVGLAYSL